MAARRRSTRLLTCVSVLLVAAAAVCGLFAWSSYHRVQVHKAAVAAPVPVVLPQTLTAGKPFTAFSGTTAQPAHVVSSLVPTHLFIPSIGVNTTVAPTTVTRKWDKHDHQYEPTYGTPPDMYTTTWWSAVKPGERGPHGELPVILGHTQLGGGYGVFNDLDRLQPGAQVILQDASGGAMLLKVVAHPQRVSKADPTGLLNVQRDAPASAGLILISCDGDSGDANIVVFAAQVPAES